MGPSLPLALAIALTPFAVIPAILVQLSPHGRTAGSAFLGGWSTGILLATSIGVLLPEIGGADGSTPLWLAWLQVVLGVALLAYGLRSWLTRHTPVPTPAWQRAMQEATPRSALKLGLVMALANPKVLLLAVAGGLGIGEEDYTVAENAAAVVGFSVVASLTVAAPLVMTLVTGSRAEPLLQRAREWLDAHNQAVVAVVLVLLGALVLVAGWQAVPGG